MQKSYLLAATAALALIMQTPLALAQSAPAAGGTPPAAATTASPATTTAPAATSTPAATTTPGATTDTSTGSKKSAEAVPAIYSVREAVTDRGATRIFALRRRVSKHDADWRALWRSAVAVLE